MDRIKMITTILLLIWVTNIFAKEVPYTLEDRDRLIRVETKLEGMDKRIEQLGNILIGIVVAFAGIVAATIGFAIWDRRTALTPVVRMAGRIEEKEERIERALIEYARKEPKFAEVLKHVGLL